MKEYSKTGISYDTKLITQLKIDNNIIKLFDGIITMSNFSKNNWKKYCPNKPIYMAPLGVDNKLFIPGYKKEKLDKKIFLYIGKISCLKGVHYLIQAWKELNLKNSKLQLIGYKLKNEWPFFEKLISNTKRVEYKEYIPLTAEAYKESLVFVFPTLKEGFGKVVLEAMSAGLPIITTPPAAHYVKKGENGFIIPRRDIETLKDKILYFYKNPEKAITMGKRSREIALNTGWDKFQNNFINATKEIIKEDY